MPQKTASFYDMVQSHESLPTVCMACNCPWPWMHLMWSFDATVPGICQTG